jgi:Lipocalin-like domain
MLNTAQQDLTVESVSSQLVGVWSLLSYTEEKEGCEATHPFGPKPAGFLIYTPERFVSAQLMKPARSAFQSRDWHLGTPEEYVESGSGYIAYCGTYEVDETNQTVTHIPSVALLPNLIHGRQLRALTLNGNRLTLRTSSATDVDGVLVTSHLEWERIARTHPHPTPG